MWLRTLKSWCGAKRSMRNSSCLLSCPRSCPPGNTHPHCSSTWAWFLQNWAELFPVSQLLHKIKVIHGDGVVVWDSLTEQNNLKITWNYHWVASILSFSFKIFSTSPNKLFFHFGLTTALIARVHLPTEYKLKTCKKQDKNLCEFRTDGNGSGWQGMASHHGRTFSSSRDSGREWMCGQSHRRSSGKTTTTNTWLMQSAEGTPAV